MLNNAPGPKIVSQTEQLLRFRIQHITNVPSLVSNLDLLRLFISNIGKNRPFWVPKPEW